MAWLRPGDLYLGRQGVGPTASRWDIPDVARGEDFAAEALPDERHDIAAIFSAASAAIADEPATDDRVAESTKTEVQVPPPNAEVDSAGKVDAPPKVAPSAKVDPLIKADAPPKAETVPKVEAVPKADDLSRVDDSPASNAPSVAPTADAIPLGAQIDQLESSVASLIQEHDGGEPAIASSAASPASDSAENADPKQTPALVGGADEEIDSEMLAGIEAFRAQLAGAREQVAAE